MNKSKKTIIYFLISIVVLIIFVIATTTFLDSNSNKYHSSILGNILNTDYNNYTVVDIPTCPSKTYNNERQILMDDTESYILDRAKRKATPAGTYDVELILNEGYIWSDNTTENKIIQCTINPYDINNAVISKVHNQMYTGREIEPNITVSAFNKKLIINTDYIVSYSNNKNIGTATITITGIGNYTGTKEITFKIKEELDPSDLTFRVGTFNIGGWKCGNKTGGITCPESNNTKISELLMNLNLDLVGIQEGAVFDENDNTLATNINELALLSNYDLRYVAPKHINALLSKYSMSDLSQDDSNIPLTDCAYSHNNYMEKRALLKEIVNINGIDISVYVVHIGYSNCNEIHFSDIANAISNDSNPAIIMGDFNRIETDRLDSYIKPLGYVDAGHDTNYKNTGTENFMDSILVKSNGLIEVVSSETIDAYDIYSDHNLVVSTLRVKNNKVNIPTCPNKIYSGETQLLMDDTESYMLNRANRKATPAGTYDVELILNEGYVWSDNTTENKTIQCTIVPYNIENSTLSSIEDVEYTGSEIKPDVTVTALDKILVKDIDYTVSYSNNIDEGTATVTITGKGNYTGTKETTFNINRNLSSDNTLKSLTINNDTISLNPVFNPDITGYNITVENSVSEISINAVGNNPNSNIKIIGSTNLIVGSNNIIYIDVTAENGDIKRYTLRITRKERIEIPDLIDNMYLLINNNTTTMDLKTKYPSYSITVYDLNNQVVSDIAKIRSNYKIRFNDEEYTIALVGDFNIDGYVDDGDVYDLFIYTYNEIFGLPNKTISNVELKIGDYNKDGFIDDGDVYDLFIYTYNEIFGN